MKPYPFSALNHLTVPDGTSFSPLFSCIPPPGKKVAATALDPGVSPTGGSRSGAGSAVQARALGPVLDHPARGLEVASDAQSARS